MTHARALAAAQSVPFRGDVDANLEGHARLARAAAEEGAEVLVFPELSLTGYELDLAAELAFAEDDPRLESLAELAAAHRMTLVAGAPVRLGPRLHIGAFVLSPDRGVGLYTKRYLGEGEETVVQPGDRDPPLRLGGRAAAVAVCADANRTEHPRDAAARGACTYLVSSFITAEELSRKTRTLRDHATRHAMAVVFANYGGPSGGLDSGGGSAIWSETGEPLAELPRTGAGVAVAIETETGWLGRSRTLEGA